MLYRMVIAHDSTIANIPLTGCSRTRKRRPVIAQANRVVDHQDLAVTGSSGADPDRRNADGLRDLLGQRGRNVLQHNHECTGRSYLPGFLEHAGSVSVACNSERIATSSMRLITSAIVEITPSSM